MKKGFTLTELLGVIVIIAIVGGIASLTISNFLRNSKEEVYLNYVASLKTTTENHLITNYEKGDGSLIPSVGGSTTVTLKDLINAKKMEQLKDPNDEDNCDIEATRVIVQRKVDVSNNFDLTYNVYLECPRAKVECSNYTKVDDCIITYR